MLGIDFAFGVGATLTAEFLIAHAFLWYRGGGSKNASSIVSTVENDLSRVKTDFVTLEQKGFAGIKSLANTFETDVKAGVSKIEQYVHIPSPPAPAAQNTPSGGGTPVPSVVMSAPPK